MQVVEPIRTRSKIERVKQVLKLKKERDFLLFVMGINCGLRISDLLKLKISDVKNKTHIEITEQKTGKNKRFPITPVIKSVLSNYIKNKKPEQWLFASQKGPKAITRIQAYRIIKDASKIAGLDEHIGTHSLRKSFGYHFYQQTKDVALLQNILNHSSPNVTLRYIGINQDIIDSQLNLFSL